MAIKDLNHFIEVMKSRRGRFSCWKRSMRLDAGFSADISRIRYDAYDGAVKALELYRENELKGKYPEVQLTADEIKFLTYINQKKLDINDLYKYVEQLTPKVEKKQSVPVANIIKLNIPENIFGFGPFKGEELAKIIEEQALDKINPNMVNEIYFPENVELIAYCCSINYSYDVILNKYPNMTKEQIKFILTFNNREL